MPAPDLLFEHGLDVKKGWFDMASLDYSAKLSSTVEYSVKRGRVVHVGSDGTFVPGAHETNVAIFLLNGSEDADVSNPGTTAAGNFMHQAVAPTGKLSGLVATGGYEISSTEYDSTKTYTPGDLLTAAQSLNNAAVGGVHVIFEPCVGIAGVGVDPRDHEDCEALRDGPGDKGVLRL